MKSALALTVLASIFAAGAAFSQASPGTAGATQPDHAAKAQRHFDQRFKQGDKNGDGLLDRDETADHKRLSARFDEIDSNKDGKLSREEIQAFHAASHAKRRQDHEERFKSADKDGDGALSKSEVEEAHKSRIAKHFDAIDANKDSKLTREELRAYMMSRHQGKTETR